MSFGVTACVFMFYNLEMAVYGKMLFNQSIDDNLLTENNITNNNLTVKLSSFVFDDGTRREGEPQALRIPPKYYPPSQRRINVKVLDLMKQSIYATQDRLKALEPVLDKYSNNPAFRMAFIFNKLKQLIIDIRRIYTVAFKQRWDKRTFEAIIWYSHCVRKYIDILYIVEHTIELHTRFDKAIQDGETPEL